MVIAKILFVCMANIVRSPAAENLFNHAVRQRGFGEDFVVDSAGTTPGFSGRRPHPVMTRIAASRGIENTGLSRTFTPRDFERFDMILVMDRWNYEDLAGMADHSEHRQKIHYLREFDTDHTGGDLEIEDPITGTPADFEAAFDVIRACVEGLLVYLLDEGNQPGVRSRKIEV